MRTTLVASIFVFCLFSCAFMRQTVTKTATTKPDQAELEKLLDTLHKAASKTDDERYFACFAPDAVFLGTDAKERWTLDEFKAFVKPLFDKNKGWTYTPRKEIRHFSFGPDGSYVWFDELLDNAKYGECRGTGVLRKVDGQWKIAQYSLSFPVPNLVAAEVVKVIREFKATGAHAPK